MPLVNIWPLILLSFAFDQGKNMQVTRFWYLFLRGARSVYDSRHVSMTSHVRLCYMPGVIIHSR